jgi:DNA-binding FadR family transcriptional regulator
LIEYRHGLGDVVFEHQCWRDIETDLLQIRTEAGLIDDFLPDLFKVRRIVELGVVERAARKPTLENLAIRRYPRSSSRPASASPRRTTQPTLSSTMH